jgi:hypothetical protein
MHSLVKGFKICWLFLLHAVLLTSIIYLSLKYNFIHNVSLQYTVYSIQYTVNATLTQLCHPQACDQIYVYT